MVGGKRNARMGVEVGVSEGDVVAVGGTDIGVCVAFSDTVTVAIVGIGLEVGVDKSVELVHAVSKTIVIVILINTRRKTIETCIFCKCYFLTGVFPYGSRQSMG